MSRLSDCFGQLKSNNKKALGVYIVAGDPNPEVTLPAMHAMVKAGADFVELGVPFSDPMAEGPVIQRGHERALEHKTSLRECLRLIKAFRETDTDTPVILMGYANPVERMGYEVFADAAVDAGVDGLLTVDLPPEEAEKLQDVFKPRGLESIFLLAPTSAESRVEKVANLAGGFIYYVSLKGVTGAGNLDIESVKDKMHTIRSHSKLPVMIGFGIKDGPSAKAVGAFGDGVIVGSALVSIMGEAKTNDDALNALSIKVKEIRDALDTLS